MYIAMNRFRIARGFEEAFVDMWRQRESSLDDVSGFIEFKMLEGPVDEEAALYISHTLWKSHEAFVAWTKSDNFRKAHSGGSKAPKGTYLGHPKFEGFEVIL